MTAIVLLPGMDGTGSLFEPFIAALGPKFEIRIVRYPVNRPLNYEELEAIAREAIPREGPFFLLGESFSGPIAVSLAAASSGSPGLKGLILCCSFVRNPLPAFAFLQPLIRVLPVKFAPMRALSRLALGRFSSLRLCNALVHAISQVSSPVFRARLRAVLSADVTQKLTRINVPVLYLRARQDRVVPQSASSLVTRLCPQAQLATMEGPHFLLQARPAEAAEIVSHFIHKAEQQMSDHVSVFRGIRFARAERFRPPIPVPLSETPSPGEPFGAPAPQNCDPLDYMWGETLAPGDEDCLTLNIWTPAADNARRPVMVYIHGGSFIIGSGRWGWYEGTRLVQREQVVLVTVNYRLGAFGFLDLSVTGNASYARAANCGLLDQIAALEWVKQNILRFGGNPDSVTVFGESAGGISISCLLACPQAKGLFHRAICMSGPPSMVRSKEFAGRVTEKLMRFAGVDRAESLATIPAATLLAAQDKTIRSADFLGELLFAPTVDGDVLPEPPLYAIRAGSAADVTLLTGTTLDEARLWSLYNPILRVLPMGALGRWFRSLGLDPKAVRAAYREVRPELGLGALSMAAAGDSLFWLPQIRLAEAQATRRTDTRMYIIAWKTPVLGGRLGAPHAVEEPMMFGNLDAKGAEYMIGKRPEHLAEREAFSQAMQRAWAAFARTGDPSHPGIPDWPAYESNQRATMLLDRHCRVENDPLSPIRRAWDALPFDGVHPAVEELPRIADITRYLAVRGVICLGAAALVAAALRAAW